MVCTAVIVVVVEVVVVVVVVAIVVVELEGGVVPSGREILDYFEPNIKSGTKNANKNIFHIQREKIVFLKGNRSSSHVLSGA